MTSIATTFLILATLFSPAASALEPTARGSVELTPCADDQRMLCGDHEVWENRATARGRRIRLAIRLLPARNGKPEAEPVFFLAGGPGGSATARAPRFLDSWLRREREMVFVDQRGTGASNPLFCDLPGSMDDLQGYLVPSFSDPGVYRRCRKKLRKIARPKLYNTPIAMDDIDEVRAAMGYASINLYAGSWGTRSALVYIRRHGDSVRSALLNAVAPPALVYPVYQPSDAQQALDLLFAECADDPDCSTAFPDLAGDFDNVLDRLDRGPAEVTIENWATGEPVTVELGRDAFTNAVRWLMTSLTATRWLPLLIHEAAEGSFETLTQAAVENEAFLRDRLKVGQLLSVVCAGDVPRIDRSKIPELTAGTFMGDAKVRQIVNVCRKWPKGKVPADFGEPVVSDVPVLMWSGTLDPANPPYWAEDAVAHLSRGRHIVVPAAHGVSGDCFDAIGRRFLQRASVEGLPVACTRHIEMPPFQTGG